MQGIYTFFTPLSLLVSKYYLQHILIILYSCGGFNTPTLASGLLISFSIFLNVIIRDMYLCAYCQVILLKCNFI
ncbi:hypothetical protein TREVI0001_1922 [Treponema vincentii ATCC 35580]|uniref:Uncharacterized protein n=1 Tax=Treponema vincentii ATCC 35580 TaxID=596324 RepID=C8PPH9_9SPIR|nr:hypothetical protein TREVI0001_1922 [Treponema vincentii ATCC 35580]